MYRGAPETTATGYPSIAERPIIHAASDNSRTPKPDAPTRNGAARITASSPGDIGATREPRTVLSHTEFVIARPIPTWEENLSGPNSIDVRPKLLAQKGVRRLPGRGALAVIVDRRPIGWLINFSHDNAREQLVPRQSNIHNDRASVNLIRSGERLDRTDVYRRDATNERRRIIHTALRSRGVRAAWRRVVCDPLLDRRRTGRAGIRRRAVEVVIRRA
jgi:hypothetical protein